MHIEGLGTTRGWLSAGDSGRLYSGTGQPAPAGVSQGGKNDGPIARPAAPASGFSPPPDPPGFTPPTNPNAPGARPDPPAPSPGDRLYAPGATHWGRGAAPPGRRWDVDSFFDITYRIDFAGAPPPQPGQGPPGGVPPAKQYPSWTWRGVRDSWPTGR